MAKHSYLNRLLLIMACITIKPLGEVLAAFIDNPPKYLHVEAPDLEVAGLYIMESNSNVLAPSATATNSPSPKYKQVEGSSYIYQLAGYTHTNKKDEVRKAWCIGTEKDSRGFGLYMTLSESPITQEQLQEYTQYNHYYSSSFGGPFARFSFSMKEIQVLEIDDKDGDAVVEEIKQRKLHEIRLEEEKKRLEEEKKRLEEEKAQNYLRLEEEWNHSTPRFINIPEPNNSTIIGIYVLMRNDSSQFGTDDLGIVPWKEKRFVQVKLYNTMSGEYVVPDDPYFLYPIFEPIAGRLMSWHIGRCDPVSRPVNNLNHCDITGDGEYMTTEIPDDAETVWFETTTDVRRTGIFGKRIHIPIIPGRPVFSDSHSLKWDTPFASSLKAHQDVQGLLDLHAWASWYSYKPSEDETFKYLKVDGTAVTEEMRGIYERRPYYRPINDHRIYTKIGGTSGKTKFDIVSGKMKTSSGDILKTYSIYPFIMIDGRPLEFVTLGNNPLSKSWSSINTMEGEEFGRYYSEDEMNVSVASSTDAQVAKVKYYGNVSMNIPDIPTEVVRDKVALENWPLESPVESVCTGGESRVNMDLIFGCSLCNAERDPVSLENIEKGVCILGQCHDAEYLKNFYLNYPGVTVWPTHKKEISANHRDLVHFIADNYDDADACRSSNKRRLVTTNLQKIWRGKKGREQAAGLAEVKQVQKAAENVVELTLGPIFSKVLKSAAAYRTDKDSEEAAALASKRRAQLANAAENRKTANMTSRLGP